MKSFLFSCLTIFLFLSNKVSCQDVKEQFIKSEIVPDIIDTPPEEIIRVNFLDNFVKLGNELTPTEVKTAPDVQWESSSDTYHVFMMVDPDARSKENPTVPSVALHWLVVNVPGSNLNQGETTTEFIPSGPPKDSGLHRYVFLVYEQDGKREFDEPIIPGDAIEERFNFSVRDFEKKYEFKGPKAGNFYLAQWDESVTEHRK